MKFSVPQSSMCVAALDLSPGTSYTNTFLAKDPPHRRLETMFSRLQSRLARIFDEHIGALKHILRIHQKREEWPCNLLEVEDIDAAKNFLTIFNKIRIETCWLNTELFIRLIEALPDEKSCDEAQQHLNNYHESLDRFCASVLLMEIPNDDAYLNHFRSRAIANVTYDVNLEDFDFSKLLEQKEFLSRIFKIPKAAFHYLEAKTTESTLVTWALVISIKESCDLLQRAADEFWSLKEHSIIKVEIAGVGVLYLRGKDLPKLIKKALQDNQDFLSCTEHVSHQFLALVDYPHLKRRDTEEYHSVLSRLPLPKPLLQDSVSLNVVEPREQEQTSPSGDSPAQPSDPSGVSTAPTEPHPSQVLPTTEHTDPPGASDHTGMLDGTTPATPTGPYLTTPTGPTQTITLEITPTCLTPLMLAASEGNDEIVTSLLRADANVSQLDNDGRTALHHACVSGHLEVVRTLMDKEPSLVNQGDEVEHPPLMLAASQGYHEVVSFLTTMPETIIHKTSKNRRTALHLACLAGHLEVVGTLLDAGAIIDDCDESGLTPLMLAASEGHDEVVTSLLSADANVSQLDNDGRTALHHACVSGHLEVVDTLMDEEPSLVNQGDEVEHTPLMLAASQGHQEVVKILTTMPETMIHVKSKKQRTALDLACLAGHLEVVGTLLHAGAIIDECDESGLTPLMLAASKDNDGMVGFLLRAGANVLKQDSDGKTALHYAAEQGATLSVNELLLSGASIDLKDVYGHTPLTIATIKRQNYVAIQLIQTGADVTHLTRHEGRDLAEEVLSFAIQANLTQNTNYQNFCALFQQDSGVNLQNWTATYKHSVATLILSQLRTVWFKHPTLLVTDPPMTELMWATRKGYDSLVKYLILQGVDVNAQNPQGNKALHFAAQGNHIQCGLLLAKAGANVRTTNEQFQSPFDVSTAEFRNINLEMLSFQTKKVCCVLGNGLNGKSTLIASLQNENENRFTKARHWLFGVSNVSQRTAGIEPVSLSSKRYGNVLFYDFAGQHEYHGPHELFLESIISRGLSSIVVVVVVNITEKQSVMFRQLIRWLHPFYKLPSTTNPIPVILVGSHLDKAKRQDEAKHNLDMCCEQLKNQGDSVLQFGSICCLDCRQPYAPDIQKLCKYLQDVPLPQCGDSRTGYSLPWVISLIRSSFTEEVVPLSRFADWICQNKDNLPTNLPPAEDVCRDLASTGHFLYLPSKKALSEGWLVLDLPSIHKDVYGNLLSSGMSKVSKFGLLSCAELPALFPRFHPTMVRSILISFGFGVEVDSSFLSEATHLIESTDRKHEHLFIPALVAASQPNVFANASGSAHMFCWQFEVDKKLFLSPRILQAVILQLASHHVFTHKQGSEVRTLASGCSVWLNGIFWKCHRDADVAVQISDNTTIHVIGCSEVSAEALCRYMSTIVQDIARTIKSIDANIYGSAYIVCPQPANLQFLLENPRPPAHQKFPIDVMLDNIQNGSETTTSLDSSNSPWQRKIISELFGGFKPSMEAVKGFLVLQDSTAQPSDPSSGLTTTTGPTQTPHNDPLMSMPNMEILDSLVVWKIASKWQRVCIYLGIPPEVQKAIQANHPSDVEQCCRNMFIRWLSPKLGSGAKPRTWESVLSALQKAGYPHVAEAVRREITGHTAIISSSSVVTPIEDILTAPSDSLLTTFTGLTLTTPTGSYLSTPTSLLLSLPNIETLDLFVVYEVAARWQHVGVHLGMTSALQIIQANHPSNVVQCCHDMFDRWLFSRKGTGEKPRTWEIVLSALENANYSNVAADLRRELDPAS